MRFSDKIGDSPIEEPFNLTKIENGEQVLSDFYVSGQDF